MLTTEQEIQLETLFGSVFRQKIDNRVMQPLIKKYGIGVLLKVLNYLVQQDRHVLSPYKYLARLCSKYK